MALWNKESIVNSSNIDSNMPPLDCVRFKLKSMLKNGTSTGVAHNDEWGIPTRGLREHRDPCMWPRHDLYTVYLNPPLPSTLLLRVQVMLVNLTATYQRVVHLAP